MSYQLKIEGLDELKKALSGFSGTINKHVKDALKKSLYLLHGDMAVYPPPPPNSSYIRTGTLGRRWTVKVEAASLVRVSGFIANPTEYGPYVQDEEEQAEVHVGRWQTIQSVLRNRLDEIYGFFRAAIKAAIQAIGRKA